MRTITKKPQPKMSPKIIAAVALLVVIGVVGVFLWYQQPKHTSPPTSDTPSSNAPTKQEVSDKPAPSTVPSNDVPISTTMAVTITKLEQANGSVVISGAVTDASAGTCVAEFTTPQDKPVVKEIKAAANGDNATCGPITIDEVEFSYLGNWNAKLTFYTTDQSHQASSESKVIAIK